MERSRNTDQVRLPIVVVIIMFVKFKLHILFSGFLLILALIQTTK